MNACLHFLGSEVAIKIESILTATTLKKDIKQLSKDVQTSSLESFHSVILGFAPKQTVYSYIGMTAR